MNEIKKHLAKIAISLTAIATVLGHYLVRQESTKETKEIVQSITQKQVQPVRDAVQASKLELERQFVRREDMNRVVTRMDAMNSNMEDMQKQLSELEGYLKGRERRRSEIFWGKR